MVSIIHTMLLSFSGMIEALTKDHQQHFTLEIQCSRASWSSHW